VRSTELVVIAQPRSFAAESFRRLHALLTSENYQGARAIVTTSATPSEGKSLIAMNLALTIAAGKDDSVLLLDADLRRPSIETYLKPQPSLGLSDILSGRTTLEHVVIDIEDSMLSILPAGKVPHDPVELLSSERMRNLMMALRKLYKWIIIDTPPIVPFTDADAVGRLSDGFLMVARAGHTPIAAFKKAIALASAAPILGSVLNDAHENFADHNYKYDRYYNSYYAKDKKK
jgi:receptor protein-tyrosine kinase/non-specific protein-tyrosine kinase